MWAVIAIEYLLLSVLCVYILQIVCNLKKTPIYAIVSTWFGWLLCFMIVLLVPFDILDTDHRECLKEHGGNEDACSEPATYLPDVTMQIQWRVLYWGTFVLSWLVFPILQTYFLSGDFTIRERLLRSVKENVFLYVVLAILGAFGLVVLAIGGNLKGPALLDFVMALANAYGLILTVVLMGYGLVDIPRYLFRKADREDTLKHYHVQAYKYKDSMDTASDNLGKTLKVVKKLSDRIRDGDPYRPYVDIIQSKCPLEYDDVVGDIDWNIDTLGYSKLVALHCRVMDETHSVARSDCLYEVFLKKAFAIEDIIKEKEAEVKAQDAKMHWSFKSPRTHRFAHIVDTIEYYWEVYLHTSWYRILATLAALLSLLIVWSEITLVMNGKINLSPFAFLISAMHMEGFGKQVFCFIPLCYMALCAYTTLFKIKIFNYYRLVPHQMSDANSIMFSANYLCRLAAPLSYNFLRIVNQNDSAFNAVMGEMDAFPLLGKKFTIFFPIFVTVLCFGTIFNIWSRVASLCCIKRLRYQPDDDVKLAQEGARILRDERDKREGKHDMKPKGLKDTIFSSIKKVTRFNKNGADEDEEEHAHDKAASSLSNNANNNNSNNNNNNNANKSKDVAMNDILPASSKFSRSYERSYEPSPSYDDTSSSTSIPASTNRYSMSHEAYDDLLPPTSKFARKPNSSSSSNNSAIITTNASSSSINNNDNSQKRSLLGGWFGKNNNNNNNNRDEDGLLGHRRADSMV